MKHPARACLAVSTVQLTYSGGPNLNLFGYSLRYLLSTIYNSLSLDLLSIVHNISLRDLLKSGFCPPLPFLPFGHFTD